VVEFGDHKQPV